MVSRLDVCLRNGRLIDGSGAPSREADIGICGDRIVAVGPVPSRARREIDVSGCVVTPGFIDVHAHSDLHLLVEPGAESKLRQGVTTEIMGHCGASAAPRTDTSRWPADWASLPLDVAWHSVAEYRATVEAASPAVNTAMLVGHNTLRRCVLGDSPRCADRAEIAAMEMRLETAMAQGARGLSLGLLYPPGCFAGIREIQALARVTARGGGIVATHLRSESDHLPAALEEALSLARRTGVALHVAHLKTSGRRNWRQVSAVIAAIETARSEGLRVSADRYPYTASATDLDILFPQWALAGGADAERERLDDPVARARIVRSLAASRAPRDWQRVRVGGTWHASQHRFRGRTLGSVARTLGCSPAEAVVRLVERDHLRTGGFFFTMCEANLRRILACPWVMVGSDAAIQAPEGVLGGRHPHPRAYGTFPRFVRLFCEKKIGTLEEAVRRMTALPARTWNLTDRGEVRPGAFADLAAWRPAHFRDAATFTHPHRLAQGMDFCLVNGKCAIVDGCLTGIRAGRML